MLSTILSISTTLRLQIGSSRSAPRWRRCKPGLNIEGYCTEEGCCAEVCSPRANIQAPS